MKEYQVLISGILIAVAIYLGLTYTAPEPFIVPDPYEGSVPVDPSSHDTDLEVCINLITKALENNDGEMSYGEAVALCISRGNS
jgi:hypothetical protein